MAKPNPCPWAALPRDAERVVLDRFSEVLSGQKPKWLGLSRLLKERHDQDVHRDKLARWYKKYQGEDKRASAASPVPSAGAVVQAPPTVTPADTGDNDPGWKGHVRAPGGHSATTDPPASASATHATTEKARSGDTSRPRGRTADRDGPVVAGSEAPVRAYPRFVR